MKSGAPHPRVTGIYTLGNTAAVLGGIQDCGRLIGADVGMVARAEGVIEAGLTPAISTMSMAARQCATVFVDLIRDVRLNGPVSVALGTARDCPLSAHTADVHERALDLTIGVTAQT